MSYFHVYMTETNIEKSHKRAFQFESSRFYCVHVSFLYSKCFLYAVMLWNGLALASMMALQIIGVIVGFTFD